LQVSNTPGEFPDRIKRLREALESMAHAERTAHKEYRDAYRAEHEQTLVDITKENKRLRKALEDIHDEIRDDAHESTRVERVCFETARATLGEDEKVVDKIKEDLK
jgi:adenylosuccinate synthase